MGRTAALNPTKTPHQSIKYLHQKSKTLPNFAGLQENFKRISTKEDAESISTKFRKSSYVSNHQKSTCKLNTDNQSQALDSGLEDTASKFSEFLSEDSKDTQASGYFTSSFALSCDENSNPGCPSSLNKNNNFALANLLNSKIVKQVNQKQSPLPDSVKDTLRNIKKPLCELSSRKRNFENFRLYSEKHQDIAEQKIRDRVDNLYKTPAEHREDAKLLKTRASTFDNFTPKTDSFTNSDLEDDYFEENSRSSSGYNSSKKLTPIQETSKTTFLKTIQPKRFIEWSDDTNNFLTVQNYMTSLRMTKCKFPKTLNEKVMDRHPELESRMRGILLDWLMEVCECFFLQRSTFYLAQSYLDTFLARTGLEPKSQENTEKSEKSSEQEDLTNTCVSKSQLQLLGITCLFVAAKIEEIDPPRLSKFAFITDGACSESDIVLQEMTLLQGLNWLTHPVTSYDWLRLYLQTTYFYLVKKKEKKEEKTTNGKSKLTPVTKKKQQNLNCLEVSKDYIEKLSFTPMVFAQMCQLLDLASLDINCLRFKPHELAASILYHFSSQSTAKKASNLNMNSLRWFLL